MIVADHPLPLLLQTRVWQLGAALCATFPTSGPFAPVVFRLAPVLDGSGIIVDVVETSVGDKGPVWDAATWPTGHPRFDRLNWARWCEEQWLVHMVRWRAEHEGRELIGLPGPELEDLIEDTLPHALNYRVSMPCRPQWLLHYVALHERQIRDGREPSTLERLREETKLEPLRRRLEAETRAAAAWWQKAPHAVRRPHEKVSAHDDAEHQVGARRTHLAMAAERYVEELTAQEASLVREIGGTGDPHLTPA